MTCMVVERIPVAEGVALHTLVWRGEGGPGSSRPFLLVHGLASNCQTWSRVAERLHDEGHSVAAVDLRGHGHSDTPDDGYDFETLTSDLFAAIAGLGFERPVVVGQSTGGNLAVELADRMPEEVAGVVGVDGGVLELADRWPRWEECEEALAPPRLAGRSQQEMAEMVRDHHPDWSDEGVAATLANFEVLADGTVRPWLTFDRHMRILRALWEQRPSSVVGALTVPVLLLLADSGDEWMPSKRRTAERAASIGANVRVEWLKGDHDLHVQLPDAVSGALLAAVRDGFLPS
jgi:pimeloyl-ACP methyl ester carboxylesterase